jgi:hypothetical protein
MKWWIRGMRSCGKSNSFFPIVGLLPALFSTQFVRRRQMGRISE